MTETSTPPEGTTFVDSTGHEWDVQLNVAVAEDVVKDTDFDLYSVVNDGAAGLGRLATDDLLMCSIVWIAISEEAGDLTRSGFLRRMRGDAIHQARFALMNAISLFLPDRAARELISATIGRAIAVSEHTHEQAMEAIDQLRAMTPEQILANAKPSQSNASGSLPELQASLTPVNSPSGRSPHRPTDEPSTTPV